MQNAKFQNLYLTPFGPFGVALVPQGDLDTKYLQEQ